MCYLYQGSLAVDGGIKSRLGVNVIDQITGNLQDIPPGMGVTEILEEAVGSIIR